jgi:glycosyltransferase involved in cell wall biosynthesis
MDVFLMPFFLGNQYLDSLREHLESTGVSVATDERSRPFRLFLVDLIGKRPDVLHLHWSHPYFLFGSKKRLYDIPLSKQFCRLAAIVFLFQVWVAGLFIDRIVWTVHNKCNHERRYESLDRWVTERLLGMVDAVQLWDDRTESEFREYVESGLPSVHNIPHGNYCEIYETVPEWDARERLNLPQDERVYLYFGMIRPYKNVLGLLDAFKEIEEAHLVVAGNPKDDELEAEIRTCGSHIRNLDLFLEYIPDSEVPLYFSAADIAVLPYNHVFNSGSALLAMSLGTPVVAPPLGSIPTVLPEGNILYDHLEVGLAEAMSKSEAELREVGARNERVACEEHDWDSITKDILEMYHGGQGS